MRIPFDQKLYPTVGLRRNSEQVVANFGQRDFVFDIDSLWKVELQTTDD
jgi:hypothetical protein